MKLKREELENKLRAYEVKKQKVGILHKKLNEVESDYVYRSNAGIDFKKDKVTHSSKVQTSGIAGNIEDTAIKVIEEKERIENEIRHEKSQLTILEMALEALSETERDVIVNFYVKGKQWWQVSNVVKMSERACRCMRNKAINKLLELV